MAKPAGFAAQSVASSSQPVATPSSALALLVPQVQQTRNASPWGLLLMWAALPGPQRELRMQEEQPRVSHEQLSLVWGAAAPLGQVTKWFHQLCSESWAPEQGSDVSLSLCASAAQVPCSINPSQTHKSMALGIYIHTYTRTHSFQLRVTRAFLCVCELTTPVCRHGKKRVFVLYEYGSFFILWACKVKKKKKSF